MKRLTLILSLAGIAALVSPLEAQGRRGGGEQQRERDSIPAQYRPPPGMCRIWLKDVRPQQQPAPTDCATAVRNRPPNGRVIFGPEPPKSKAPPPGKNESRPPRTEPPIPIPPRRGPPPA